MAVSTPAADHHAYAASASEPPLLPPAAAAPCPPGKLKDLGNMVLGKFGLSLNNFKAEQDPQTGSYSIQFVQQPGAGAAAGAEATSREVGPPPVGEEPPGSEDPDY